MENTFYSLTPEIVSENKFVEFWSRQYTDINEQKYYDNIFSPLTKQSILELFWWKNNGSLSTKKKDSVEENYCRSNAVPDLTSLENSQLLREFLSHAGGAIWRIFWLHCNYPKNFPIYDQHVHRAMAVIKGFAEMEIPKSNKGKVEWYIKYYLVFYRSFDVEYEDHRKVDKALWSFGKFIKSHYSFFKN